MKWFPKYMCMAWVPHWVARPCEHDGIWSHPLATSDSFVNLCWTRYGAWHISNSQTKFLGLWLPFSRFSSWLFKWCPLCQHLQRVVLLILDDRRLLANILHNKVSTEIVTPSTKTDLALAVQQGVYRSDYILDILGYVGLVGKS